jgi:hypothetical protein
MTRGWKARGPWPAYFAYLFRSTRSKVEAPPEGHGYQ